MPYVLKRSHARKPLNKLSRQQRNRIFREVRGNLPLMRESSSPILPELDIVKKDNTINYLPLAVEELVVDNEPTPTDNSISFDDIISNESVDDISSDCLSQSSYDSIFSEPKDKPSFREELASWAVENSITAVACDKLCEILRAHPCFSNLPKCTKTLLGTPQKAAKLLGVPPGEYLHFGLEEAIVKILNSTCDDDIPRTLEIDLSTDGAVLDNSQTNTIWPIQCRIANIPNSLTEVIGIYRGKKKPDSARVFFEPLVEEANMLIRDGGIVYCGSRKSFSFRAFIADAPARAFVLNHVGHAAQNPCSKCYIRGEYIERRMTLRGVDLVPRTDEQYCRQDDEDHHNEGLSPLSFLPIGMVTQVPYDYMHLVLLGVVKRLLSAWVDGKFCNKSRLCAHDISLVSMRLVHLSRYCPREFARPPRELKYYKRYKATEFRQFLLYTGPIVLFGILGDDLYKHILLLHTSMRILASTRPSAIHLYYAESALRIFVEQSENLYGRSFITYNVHGLLHVVEDVKLLGSVDAYSAFPYENNMRIFRRYCRKPSMPLQQIANRRAELAQRTGLRDRKICYETVALGQHSGGPLPVDVDDDEVQQYHRLKDRRFVLTTSRRDNCCIFKDASIGIVVNIVVRQSKFFLVNQKFDHVESLYDAAIPSSSVGYYKCSALQQNLTLVSFEDVMAKCYLMPVWQPRRLDENGQEIFIDDVFAAAAMSCEVYY